MLLEVKSSNFFLPSSHNVEGTVAPVYLGGGQKTFALLWRLLIFSTSRNSHNESQQTGALNWVSPYIISAIYSSEAVAMRLWCHLRMWNVNLIHSHYLPELICEPFVHINQKISKENVPISPRKTSSWFQLTSLPLWGVMRSSRSRAVEKKRRIIAFALEPLAVNRFCCIMEFAILSQIVRQSYTQT